MVRNCSMLVLLLAVCCLVENGFSNIREIQFEKFHMCPGSFSGDNGIVVQSKVNCVGLCAFQDTCTACHYFSNRTCSLYSNVVTAQVCETYDTSGTLYKKINPPIVCRNGGILDNGACKCQNGYVGDLCQRLLTDCNELKNSGVYPGLQGLYTVLPSQATQPIRVRCHYSAQHYILVRAMSDLNFNVSKADYVNGFGFTTYDYWIGLENLHLLTSNPYVYTMVVQLGNMSNSIIYKHNYIGFKVKAASQGYAMTFTSHVNVSAMGDCLSPLKDISFSTYDNDNDGNSSRNCAADYGGGWWYKGNCSECNLVGALRYYTFTRDPSAVNDVFYLPGLPDDFSPQNVVVYMYR